MQPNDKQEDACKASKSLKSFISPINVIAIINGELYFAGKKAMFWTNLSKFIIGNPLGIILSSLLASILASVIFSFLSKKTKIKKKKKYFVEHVVAFCLGARASKAKDSSYKQILLVGDYLIDFIFGIGYIIICLLVTIIIMIIAFQIGTLTLLGYLAIVICSFLVTYRYKKLMRYRKHYEQNFELVYTKEYLDEELDNAVKSVTEKKKE